MPVCFDNFWTSLQPRPPGEVAPPALRPCTDFQAEVTSPLPPEVWVAVSTSKPRPSMERGMVRRCGATSRESVYVPRNSFGKWALPN